MKKYLIASLIGLLFSVSAIAKIESFSARSPDGSITVTITKSPCPAKILALVNPQYREFMKSAKVVMKGKQLEACWIQLPDNSVGIIDEDGDNGNIPISEFKPDVDV